MCSCVVVLCYVVLLYVECQLEDKSGRRYSKYNYNMVVKYDMSSGIVVLRVRINFVDCSAGLIILHAAIFCVCLVS
jgi:hypothetical protein